MFKFVLILAAAAVVVAKPGYSTHSVVEPAVVGATVHAVPSGYSHQSQTQYHNKAVVTPVVAPVVKSYVAAPLVHAAPVAHVAHAAPVVHAAPVAHYEVAHVAPVHVHQVLPLYSSVHAVPAHHSAHFLHAAPLVHSLHAEPLASLHH